MQPCRISETAHIIFIGISIDIAKYVSNTLFKTLLKTLPCACIHQMMYQRMCLTFFFVVLESISLIF